MRTAYAAIISLVLSPFHTIAEPSIAVTPFLQQNAAYYSSDTVTVGGVGMGAGIRMILGTHLVAQTDTGVLWLNGNAASTRVAVGYQHSGRWSPAIFGTYGLLWGQRTEVLSSSGERPAPTVGIVGFRAAPLRFQGFTGRYRHWKSVLGLGRTTGETTN